MPIIVSIPDFARLVGVSKQNIYEQVKAGKIPSTKEGKIDLWEAMPGYIDRVRDPFVNGQTRASETGIGADYQEERARLTKAKADKEEVLAAIAKGDAISVEDAKEAAMAIGAAVQSQVKSLRATLPPMLEGQTPQQMTKTIAKQTDKILLALSDASLAIYKTKRKAT